MRRAAALCALAPLATACTPLSIPTPATEPIGNLFEDATGPLAYASLRTVVGNDRPREVASEVCQYALVVPPAFGAGFLNDPTSTNFTRIPTLGFAWGDAGFARAVAEARAQAPAGAQLYDLRFDAHTTSVLGLYVRSCVELHASAVVPRG